MLAGMSPRPGEVAMRAPNKQRERGPGRERGRVMLVCEADRWDSDTRERTSRERIAMTAENEITKEQTDRYS